MPPTPRYNNLRDTPPPRRGSSTSARRAPEARPRRGPTESPPAGRCRRHGSSDIRRHKPLQKESHMTTSSAREFDHDPDATERAAAESPAVTDRAEPADLLLSPADTSGPRDSRRLADVLRTDEDIDFEPVVSRDPPEQRSCELSARSAHRARPRPHCRHSQHPRSRAARDQSVAPVAHAARAGASLTTALASLVQVMETIAELRRSLRGRSGRDHRRRSIGVHVIRARRSCTTPSRLLSTAARSTHVLENSHR